MTIDLKNYNVIKKLFIEALEEKAIRIKNHGDIDVFLRARIIKMQDVEKKKTITSATLSGSWVKYFDLYYNSKDTERSDKQSFERKINRRRFGDA